MGSMVSHQQAAFLSALIPIQMRPKKKQPQTEGWLTYNQQHPEGMPASLLIALSSWCSNIGRRDRQLSTALERLPASERVLNIPAIPERLRRIFWRE